jgi:hypothetical protein
VEAVLAGWGDASLCLFVLRVGDWGFVSSGTSRDRSRRAWALRFRVGAEPAAGIEEEGPEPADEGESAASLAAERVILGDMRN